MSFGEVFVRTTSVFLLAIVVMVGFGASAAAQEAPTFNAEVAPILYENCASCHRKGEVAPMPLTS